MFVFFLYIYLIVVLRFRFKTNWLFPQSYFVTIKCLLLTEMHSQTFDSASIDSAFLYFFR